MESLVNYICDVYGFEISSCSIPRSSFQRLKIDFYFFVKNKISERLFYFLRDNVSPIRTDSCAWLRKIDDGITKYSIVIEKIKIDSGDGSYFYEILVYRNLFNRIKRFTINIDTAIISIDSNLSDIPELKQELRDYKVEYILR